MRVILLSSITYRDDIQFIYITCVTYAEVFQEVCYMLSDRFQAGPSICLVQKLGRSSLSPWFGDASLSVV